MFVKVISSFAVADGTAYQTGQLCEIEDEELAERLLNAGHVKLADSPIEAMVDCAIEHNLKIKPSADSTPAIVSAIRKACKDKKAKGVLFPVKAGGGEKKPATKKAKTETPKKPGIFPFGKK